MTLEQKPACQPIKEETTPEVRGLVELDPSLFAFVSGGLPYTTWGAPASMLSTSTTNSPNA